MVDYQCSVIMYPSHYIILAYLPTTFHETFTILLWKFQQFRLCLPLSHLTIFVLLLSHHTSWTAFFQITRDPFLSSMSPWKIFLPLALGIPFYDYNAPNLLFSLFFLVPRLTQKVIYQPNYLPILSSLSILKPTCLHIYYFIYHCPKYVLYPIKIWKCFTILTFPSHKMINKIRRYIFVQ